MEQSPSWETERYSVKKFPAFYGTRRFIIAFTSARHLSLSWATAIQSMPPHTAFWSSILILSSNLRLDLWSLSITSSPPKLCMHLSCPPYVPHVPPFSFFLIWSPEHYLLRITDHTSHYAAFSLPCCIVPMSPQHPILEHPQSKFLPELSTMLL
jgi:hypothetical protein